MNDNQLNVVVAEAMGWRWKLLEGSSNYHCWYDPNGNPSTDKGLGRRLDKMKFADSVVNYARSESNMRTVINTLSGAERVSYVACIEKSCSGLYAMIEAAAIVRARAFVKVKGLKFDINDN